MTISKPVFNATTGNYEWAVEQINPTVDMANEQLNGTPSENTGWDDLQNSLTGKRLVATYGKVDTDWNESSVKFEPSGSLANSNDRVIMSLQKPHSMPEIGGEMRLHIHWEQENTNAIVWSVQYRIQSNGVAKTTAWSTIESFTSNSTNNVFPYTSGTLNQITNLCVVDLDGSSISSTVQFRIARTDNLSGNVYATFIDAHVNCDQERGSREEFVK